MTIKLENFTCLVRSVKAEDSLNIFMLGNLDNANV